MSLVTMIRKILICSFICSRIITANGQQWKALNPPPGLFNSTIYSIVQDSMGVIYAAGNFKKAGTNEFMVARWNGHWEELGLPSNTLHANNTIFVLALDKLGNLYAAGGFTNASGNYYVAKWNGNSWSQLGTSANFSPNGFIYAMAVDSLNDVYVGGSFTDNNGKQYVAKWNGTSWSPVGIGSAGLNANGFIYAIKPAPNGRLYAAGYFKNASNRSYVAQWNGAGWTETAAGNPLNANDYIATLETDAQNNIYAAGAFTNTLGEYYVAKSNGTNWTEMIGSNRLQANGRINKLIFAASGELLAGGSATNSSGGTVVSKFSNNAWSEVFGTSGTIRGIIPDPAGNIIIAGDFRNANNECFVGKWNGSSFKEMGRQGEILRSSNTINQVMVDKSGNVFARGIFWDYNTGDIIAKWDGIGWRPVLNPNGPDYHHAELMAIDTAGSIYIAGEIRNAAGQYPILKWNGTQWIELNDPLYQIYTTTKISNLLADSLGNLFASGTFNINGFGYSLVKWNGTNWSGYPTYSGGQLITFAPGGGFYGAGMNPAGSYSVYHFDSTYSNELGTGTNRLNANNFIKKVVADRNGNVYATGYFHNAAGNSYVAKWNGTNWSELGNLGNLTMVDDLLIDSASNLYAGVSGAFNPQQYVAKWTGTSWIYVGQPGYFTSNVSSLAKDNRGNIYATGAGNGANPVVSYFGNSTLVVSGPILSNLQNVYCSTAGIQKIGIINLPGPGFQVQIRLNNTTLNLNADSSFNFTTATLPGGLNKITVYYIKGTDSLLTEAHFIIQNVAAPDVDLMASATNVTDNTPVTLTAIPVAGTGTVPLFTFSGNASFTNILQAESPNASVTIPVSSLATGPNKFFVRMRPTGGCYTTQTGVDSIVVSKSVPTAVPAITANNIRIFPSIIESGFSITGLSNTKRYLLVFTNTSGQVVYESTVTGSSYLQLPVPAGLYFMTINSLAEKKTIASFTIMKK